VVAALLSPESTGNSTSVAARCAASNGSAGTCIASASYLERLASSRSARDSIQFAIQAVRFAVLRAPVFALFSHRRKCAARQPAAVATG
jgi:hypothetical protein